MGCPMANVSTFFFFRTLIYHIASGKIRLSFLVFPFEEKFVDFLFFYAIFAKIYQVFINFWTRNGVNWSQHF